MCYQSIIDQHQLNRVSHGHALCKHQLLNLYIVNADECIALLRIACEGRHEILWRKAATDLHLLSKTLGVKGIEKMLQKDGMQLLGSEQQCHAMINDLKQIISIISNTSQKNRNKEA